MKQKTLPFSMCLMLSLSLFSSVAAVELVADIHGFVSQGYMISTRNNYIEDSRRGTFDFREYGINASVKPFDPLTLGGQVAGREYGSVGNDAIYIDWLTADYALWDAFSLRAGRMKVPLGLYNETRDIDSLRTEIMLPQGVYTEYIREYFNSVDGAAVYGHIPCGAAGGFAYQFQYGERNLDPDNGDLKRIMAGAGLTPTGFDQKGHYSAQIIWDTPIENLRLGATGSSGKYNMDVDGFGTKLNSEITRDVCYVLSAEYTHRAFIFASEFMQGTATILTPITYPVFPPPPAPPIPTLVSTTLKSEQKYKGYYLKGEYRFNSYVAAATGYSYLTVSVEDSGVPWASKTETEQHDIFVSLRVDLTENLILKLEQHFLTDDGGFFATENPQGEKDFSTLTAVKLSFVF